MFRIESLRSVVAIAMLAIVGCSKTQQSSDPSRLNAGPDGNITLNYWNNLNSIMVEEA